VSTDIDVFSECNEAFALDRARPGNASSAIDPERVKRETGRDRNLGHPVGGPAPRLVTNGAAASSNAATNTSAW